MKRRRFAQLAAAIAVPAGARAQSRPGAAKIGFISSAPKPFTDVLLESIMGGVRESNRSMREVETLVRLSGDDPSRLASLTAEVLALNVSVLLGDGPKHLRIAQAATRTVPIVAIDFEDDPVAAGYARSIARPGGNVTGIFLDLPDFTGKWIEFLRECMPRLSSIALMWDPSTGPTQLSALTKVAATLGIRTELFEVKERDAYARALALAKDHGAEAAILLSTPLIPSITKTLAELSLRHKLPTITMFSDFARAGGLLSYGPNLFGAFRQIGMLMGKVLSGTAPADLPIERPTKFEFLVNLRAAQALGLTIPPSIIGRADEVIE
jgi:putative ABC transport system substrate-binding protein